MLIGAVLTSDVLASVRFGFALLGLTEESALYGNLGFRLSSLQLFYLVVQAGLLVLRLVLVVAFLLWLFTGFLLEWTKLTIYRLFEADRGALTVISGFFTALVAAIEFYRGS